MGCKGRLQARRDDAIVQVALDTAICILRTKQQVAGAEFQVVNKLMATYKNGPGARLETAAGTKFGVLNAVTHFIDYETGARSNNNRFKSGQFGPGANKKAETVKLLLAA